MSRKVIAAGFVGLATALALGVFGAVRAQEARDEIGATALMRAVATLPAQRVRELLDSGADPNATSNGGATALMWATGDLIKVRLLLDRGAAVNAKTKDGDTALVTAARRGTLDAMRLLIERGANPKTSSNAAVELLRIAYGDRPEERDILSSAGLSLSDVKQNGAPTLAGYSVSNPEAIRVMLDLGASPNPRGRFPLLGAAAFQGQVDTTRLLLDRGADANAKGQHGATPLMMAVAAPSPNLAVAALLLEHDASIDARDDAGHTALDWAMMQGDTGVVRMLQAKGASRGADVPAAPVAVTTPRTARAAVAAARDSLQPVGSVLYERRKCIACHHQTLPLMVMKLAVTRGITSDSDAANKTIEAITTTWNSRREDLLLGREVAGGANELSYGLLAFAESSIAPNAATDAAVINLLALQRVNGSWVFLDTRPPQADNSPIAFTAMAIRGLTVYAPPGLRDEANAAIIRARAYLRAAVPTSTQDDAFRLLGLVWARALKIDVDGQRKQLLGRQRADGGWGQLPTMAPDAYATGEALYALHMSATPSMSAAYQKGAAFLLRTQLPDGTWFVRSRAFGFQPYFETGFPHGPDQFISASATAWAALGLLYAF
jgi:ankyrin repeat protein